MKKMNFALAALLAVGTADATIISGGTAKYGPAVTDFSALPLNLSGTLLGVILALTGRIDTQFNASNSSNPDGLLNSASATSNDDFVVWDHWIGNGPPGCSLDRNSPTPLRD